MARTPLLATHTHTYKRHRPEQGERTELVTYDSVFIFSKVTHNEILDYQETDKQLPFLRFLS